MKQRIFINIQKDHADLFEKFCPFYGETIGDVIYALALRWVESNIGTPQVKELISKADDKKDGSMK